MAFLFLCTLVGFVVIIFYQQSFANEAYLLRTITQIVNRHSVGDRTIFPNRGTIMDRNMQPLAASYTVFNVFVDVRELSQREEAERENNRLVLVEFFGMDRHDFNQMMAIDANGNLLNNTHYYVVFRGLSYSDISNYDSWLEDQRAAAQARDSSFRIRDIYIEETGRRTYVMGSLAAPVIGFERGVWWGLEGWYNHYLAGGSVGRTMTTFDGAGNITTDRIPPAHGANVITTLDIDIQRFSEERAAHWAVMYQASFGAVIVMQPFTGEILAMAQYPSFDANAPADISRLTSPNLAAHMAGLDSSSQEFMDYLFRTWTNFNVIHTFEPGSIYKPVTIAKALEEGIISANQMFYCIGHKYAAGHRIHCWRHWGHGLQTLTQALANSCNVALMDIAEALGREHFHQYQRDFGFGLPTGIDFPGEASGLVFPLSGLNESELATSSFGQRFTATPIQAIASYATLINGGNVVRPYFVSQIIDHNGDILFTQTPHVQRRVISRATSDWVRQAMEYAITDGTGLGALIEGFPQGGKTSTGEQGIADTPDFSYSLSFIGYFPVDNPQYLIMALLHDIPEEVWLAGARSVAPMYREIALEIMNLRGITPTGTMASPDLVHEFETIENFTGLTVQQAVTRLNFLGLDYTIVGTQGDIILSQFPAPDTRITATTRVSLSLSNSGNTNLTEVPNVVGLPVPFAREILAGYGFVARIVYENLPAYNDDIEAVVYAQAIYGIRLPAGTEILLRAQYGG